jgi:hypothetical protein
MSKWPNPLSKEEPKVPQLALHKTELQETQIDAWHPDPPVMSAE